MAEDLVPCPRCIAYGVKTHFHEFTRGCLLCSDPDVEVENRPGREGPSIRLVPAGLALQYALLGHRTHQDYHEVASLRRAYFYEHG
jgi:hypothetical protein